MNIVHLLFIFVLLAIFFTKLFQAIVCSKRKLKSITKAERAAHVDLDNETDEEFEYRQYLIKQKETLYTYRENSELIFSILMVIASILILIIILF